MGADLIEHATGEFSRAVYVKGGSGDPSVCTGTVDSVAVAPTFTVASLSGYGDDYFDSWYAYVVWDKDGAAAAPQGESQAITGYTSSTGTFSHAAFTAPLVAGDKVLISLTDPNVAWGDATLANQTTIITDTEKLYDVAFGVSPADGSLASFIATGGTALGTRLPASTSLYDILGIEYVHDSGNFTHSIRRHLRRGLAGANTTDVLAEADSLYGAHIGKINDVNRVAGKTQVKTISVTAAANAAADTTLATVTTQGCIIQTVIIHADAAQTADLTSCPVYGGASKVLTFISASYGSQPNLNAENKQCVWVGERYLPTGSTIVMVHNGAGATALDLTVEIKYKAVANGGYLA